MSEMLFIFFPVPILFFLILFSTEFIQVISDAEEIVEERERLAPLIKRSKELLSDLDVNYLLGPSFNDDTWEKFSKIFSHNDESMPLVALEKKIDQAGINISSQLHALLSVLSTTDTDARMLVFVITRYTASKLCKILSWFFPKYHCEVIVGREGFGGMQWRGESGQEQVLQRFRNGDTRLIVSTSVLEEGIDVQNCDLVVRFGGQPALIQLIQSKGRARKVNGKLYVIHTKDEKKHFETVTTQEAVMRIALKKFSQSEDAESLGCNSEDSNSDISPSKCMIPYTLEDQSLLQRLSSTISEDDVFSVSTEPLVRNSALVLYIQSTSSNLQTLIYDELIQSGVVMEVPRVEVFLASASTHIAAPGIFDSRASLALVSVKSTFSDVIKTLAANLSFRVSSSKPIPYWIAPMDSTSSGCTPVKIDYSSASKKDIDFESIKWDSMKRMTCGYFAGPLNFKQHSELTLSEEMRDWKYSMMEITPDRYLTISAVSCQKSIHENVIISDIGGVQFNSELQNGITICCHLSTLGSCVIASVDRIEKEFTLYITLKTTPKVYAVTKGHRKRVCITPEEQLSGDDTSDLWRCAEQDLDNLSRSPVIALCFEMKDWDSVISTLCKTSILGVPLLITKVSNSKIECVTAVKENGNVFIDEEVRDSFWTIASLLHEHYCIGLNSEVVSKISGLYRDACSQKDWSSAGIIAMAVQQMRLSLKEGNMWMDATSVFDECMEIVKLTYNSDVSFSENTSWEARLADGHVMMDRIVLTPSRIFPDESLPVKSNRLLREFSKKYHFVYASFRDEQGQRIYDEHVFRKRFMVMVKHGFRMCGKQYMYLFSSASQLREAMGVFVAGSQADVAMIRGTLIPDLSTCGKGPAKILSRLGLFCTADYDQTQLQNDSVEFDYPDLKTPSGELLTDGSGFILSSFLESLDIHNTSIIQVRVHGCKGTLLSMPRLGSTGDKKIIFRNSMKKCESPHNTLCIVKEGGYNQLRLNREIINLLCSFQGEGKAGGDWSPHQALVDLVDDALKGSVEILLNSSAAQRTLAKFLPDGMTAKLISCGVNLLTEPLWLSLLRRIYDQETFTLRTKTHIPLKQGCLLMGAPDPLGLLKDGQIFARIRRLPTSGCEDDDSFERDSDGYEVITGTVIIYRNPCLDPGDVRILEAVDLPELYYWRNVVLLPAAESCQRSIAAECSGGDTDGDQFAIIWDKRLIPPKHREFKPVNYADVLTNAKSNSQECPTTMSEEVFVGNTMRNSFLGKIANSHLAISDQLLSDRPDERY